MENQSGSQALGRELSKLSPRDHTHLTSEMRLSEAFEYLGKQTVTEIHENVEDYL